MGMVSSQKIANLLDKQISTLAIKWSSVWVVYGYNTKPENSRICWASNISTLPIEWTGVWVWYLLKLYTIGSGGIIMIVIIVSAKVIYLMSGNLATLMLHETRCIAILLPSLPRMLSSLCEPVLGSSRLQRVSSTVLQASAYSLNVARGSAPGTSRLQHGPC